MNMCDAFISGKRYDVITPEEFQQKWKIYDKNPEMFAHTAMAVEKDGINYILPFRGKTDDRPGIIYDGCVYYTRAPKDSEDKVTYNRDNINVIDFANVSNVQDYINNTEKIRSLEGVSLTEIDDLFKPSIGPNDSPAMKVFKEAVSEKNCDISKYQDRFGTNFLNDKRIFKSNDITLKKMIEMAEHLDIKVQITLSDSKEDVPNPIGREFSAVLTGGEGENDE